MHAENHIKACGDMGGMWVSKDDLAKTATYFKYHKEYTWMFKEKWSIYEQLSKTEKVDPKELRANTGSTATGTAVAKAAANAKGGAAAKAKPKAKSGATPGGKGGGDESKEVLQKKGVGRETDGGEQTQNTHTTGNGWCGNPR